MQACLLYFEGTDEPEGLRDYLHLLEHFEVSMQTWLVVHPDTAARLFEEIRAHVGNHAAFLVVPLERRLVPLQGQNAGPLYKWLEGVQLALKTGL